MGCFSSVHQRLWKSIIQPKRMQYTVNEMGPQIFSIQHQVFVRQDFTVKNKRSQQLKCSIFRNKILNPATICIIYLHGNSGSRMYSLSLVEQILLHKGVMVTFDFAACGMSEGEYISLGYHEQFDVNAIIEYLERERKMKNFVLWGRSMGAVASVYYESAFSKCKALILDSPFADFHRCSVEIADSLWLLPRCLTNVIIGYLSKTIKDKINVDVFEMRPIEKIQNIKCPIFFMGSKQDQIVNISHLQQYYHKSHNKENRIRILAGRHNQLRDAQIQKQILQWVNQLI